MTRSTRFALALIAGISFATAAGARIGSEVLAAPADGGGAPAFRPAAFIPEGEAGIAWLGEQLFFDPRLSSTGTVSCATCHDPKKSFADGLAQSMGELGQPVGRNSPTLIEIGSHDLFVDPLSDPARVLQQLFQNTANVQIDVRPVGSPIFSGLPELEVETQEADAGNEPLEIEPSAQTASISSPSSSTSQLLTFTSGSNLRILSSDSAVGSPRAISLAERCLSPLGNRLEMGTDIATTVLNYSQVASTDALFDHVFEAPGGVHRARVGEALAAYLRTLSKSAAAPYTDYLAGNTEALGEQETRGLALFSGKGTCGTCHAGETLRDGLVHVARSPNSFRIADPRLSIGQRQSGPNGFYQDEINLNGLGGGASGYGGLPVNIAATPTLWDVARTAPYFGDGTAATLEQALEIHVRELWQLRNELISSKPVPVPPGQVLDRATFTAGQHVEAQQILHLQIAIDGLVDQAFHGIPEPLRSAAGGVEFASWPFPAQFTSEELADLLAFLETLSPQAM